MGNTFLQAAEALSNPATPVLCAAHAATMEYLSPVSRRGSAQVSDRYFFSRIADAQFDSSDLIEFLKRERLFWRPLSNLAHRSRLRDIVAILTQELRPLPIPIENTPDAWLRLVSRVSKLPWTGGAELWVACLRLLWLFSPATVVRWEADQCAGLVRRGQLVKCPVEGETAAHNFVACVNRHRTEILHQLEWAAEMTKPLNEGRRYPYLAFIHDRLLAFEGATDWRRQNLVLSILSKESSRNWFIQHMERLPGI